MSEQGRITINNYDLAEHNPFERFPSGKYFVAEAHNDGKYTVHVRFDNGLGVSTEEKVDLREAMRLIIRWQGALEMPNNTIWVDLPDHVLNEPNILNKKLKEKLKRKRLYWKKQSTNEA